MGDRASGGRNDVRPEASLRRQPRRRSGVPVGRATRALGRARCGFGRPARSGRGRATAARSARAAGNARTPWGGTIRFTWAMLVLEQHEDDAVRGRRPLSRDGHPSDPRREQEEERRRDTGQNRSASHSGSEVTSSTARERRFCRGPCPGFRLRRESRGRRVRALTWLAGVGGGARGRADRRRTVAPFVAASVLTAALTVAPAAGAIRSSTATAQSRLRDFAASRIFLVALPVAATVAFSRARGSTPLPTPRGRRPSPWCHRRWSLRPEHRRHRHRREFPRALRRHRARGPRSARCRKKALAELAEERCRRRRVLGRLQHRAVAAERRREHLPGVVRQRGVERDDQARNPNGTARHQHGAVRHRRSGRASVEAPPFPCNEETHLDGRVGFASASSSAFLSPRRRSPRPHRDALATQRSSARSRHVPPESWRPTHA